LFVLVYVDDILITGSDSTALRLCFKDLDRTFALKTLGSVNYFLGFEAFRNTAGIYLTQAKYSMDLLKKAEMYDSKPCATPATFGFSLTNEGEMFSNPSLYRTLIGSLQYLTYTLPDIASVVNRLSQFLAAPKVHHWVACKRLLRYLKKTVGYGLLFSPSLGNLAISVYTNADHAGCKVTRRSTSGVRAFLGYNLIVWGSRKQTVVAQLIGEAEYRAIAQGVTKLLRLKSLISKLGYLDSISSRPIVWSDNLVAKSMAENPVFHGRTKHIELDIHFIREKVEKNEIEIRYVPTEHQIADIFTKGLTKDHFQFLCSKLGLKFSPVHKDCSSEESSLRGNVTASYGNLAVQESSN